jgi:uncharacterized protein YcbX
MTATVADICRYPVKGLNAQHLERVTLTPGQGLPQDRRFALAHGAAGADPSATVSPSTASFLTLLREEKLAQLRVDFDEASEELTILRAGKQVVHAKATDPLGRALIGEFFAGFMAGAVRGVPKLIEAKGQTLSESPDPVVSLISLASLRDLERVVRRDVHPLRFRANFYLEDIPAWAEMGWIGKEIGLGAARLQIIGPTERCAATNVNPETAERDMNIPRALQGGFGHGALGVYAQVTGGGDVATGERLNPPV